MTSQLFEAALGIKSPWFVQAVAFDASQRRLTVGIDFAPGSRFAHPTTPGEHPVYDTQIKRLRHLNFYQITELDMLVAHFTTKRTARAWLYREQLRDILDRKQINVVSAMLGQWCTNVMRSKVEPMKEVAAMIRKHFDGIAAWTQTRQTTGFVEAINGLFQAAKRKARGYTRFQTMRTVLFLIAGKLNFSEINPHTA